jgi:hypothetical protein
MLNINAFFEFKQRTRHTHSFQLAQLIYHAQHLNDYYTLPQILGTETNRRISVSTPNESVSHLLRVELEENKKRVEVYFFSDIFLFLNLSFCVIVCMHYLAIFLKMVIFNAISNVKCKEKKTRAGTSVVCFVICVCACVCI